jgi:hypothetical protein
MGKASSVYAMLTPAQCIRDLRLKSWQLIHEASAFVVSERLRQMQAIFAKYSPEQPRVPAGSENGGQWTSGEVRGSTLSVADEQAGTEREKYPNDAIEPVYPIETLIMGIYTGPVITAIRTALSTRRIFSSEDSAPQEFTSHGAIRSSQRAISRAEASEAINSAKTQGNVTTQIGKYGTKQYVYKGSNSVTAIEGSSGRNAGKIITLYRH